MRISRLLQQQSNSNSPNSGDAGPKTPSQKIRSAPKYVQNSPTKANVVANVIINSLFALGLYCLYRDYTITKEKSGSAGTVRIIDTPSNKVSDKKPSEIQQAGSFSQVMHSLTYRDLSALSVTMGFLGYITDVARQSFGKKSLIYRTSVFSLFLFPTSSYLLYKSRYDKTHKLFDY